MTEFEKRLATRLHALYQKKADELVNGSVPADRYGAHLAELRMLRDVFRISSEITKDMKEGK